MRYQNQVQRAVSRIATTCVRLPKSGQLLTTSQVDVSQTITALRQQAVWLCRCTLVNLLPRCSQWSCPSCAAEGCWRRPPLRRRPSCHLPHHRQPVNIAHCATVQSNKHPESAILLLQDSLLRRSSSRSSGQLDLRAPVRCRNPVRLTCRGGAERQVEGGQQRSRRQRDAHQIVHQRPPQVLPDLGQRRPPQVQRLVNSTQLSWFT